MPYHVGEKGSYGCSGYPAVKDDGTVMGCHDTKEKAQAQITAINISEAQKGYKKMKKYSISENAPGCEGFAVMDEDGEIDGCFSTRAQAEAYIEAERAEDMSDDDDDMMDKSNDLPTLTDQELDQVDKKAPCWEGYVMVGMKPGKDGQPVPNCVPAKKSYDMDEKGNMRYRKRKLKPTARVGTGEGAIAVTSKSAEMLEEGDFVMGITTEGVAHGVIEHIMWEGGTLGTPGSEYALESMPPENPAMSVRIYEEEEDGMWEPTAYSIGMMYQDAQYLETLDGHSMPDDEDDEYEAVAKAEGYTPPAGARSAARKAIKFKEDGKATGAGTAVGWTRARQLANGETLSLSTVKRMYSYFSRHEVDKKGKDWGNQSNPSNGYIMWLAWGGDAGYAWSKRIVQAEMDKALFINFGRDFSNVQQLTHIFKDQ